jgi:hypothetical protein
MFRSATGITVELNNALKKSLEKSGEFAGLLEQLRASALKEWNTQMAETRTNFTLLFSAIQRTVQGWLVSTEKDTQSALQKLVNLNKVCKTRLSIQMLTILGC